MVDKIIVADAGPLIAFGRVKRLSLLAGTLGEIIAPHQVLQECLVNMVLPGAAEISDAIQKKVITRYEGPRSNQYHHLFDFLGLGEAAAIILASQLKTGLLIDEKLGRQAAQKMNVPVIGTAGVLLLAKEKKLIKKVAPLVQELKAAGYYLSQELMEAVLTKAKEN